MYIGDYLGRREIYSPDTLAMIDTGKSPEMRLTYKEWNHRVNRLANWLKRHGRHWLSGPGGDPRPGWHRTPRPASMPAVNLAPSIPR